MKIKSGIILTGGLGTRIDQSKVINKHLLTINGKFIIDYPILTLKNMGITNLTVVLGGPHFSQIVSYLKDGSAFGMSINYVYQNEPSGIAQAINICYPVINNNKFVVILGDNIYENPINLVDSDKSAQMVLHKHPELYRFGVASFYNGELKNIIEKPKVIDPLLDQYAITGCYQFDYKYFDFFKKLKRSARDEYEITDILFNYASINQLEHNYVDGNWSDAGTHKSINFLNNFFYKKGGL